MDKVYEAAKKVLDKHCLMLDESTCEGIEKAKKHSWPLTNACWRCPRNRTLAEEISREAE